MPFLNQNKTNWKYILIVLILALLVGGGILWWVKTQEVPFTQLPEITKPEKPSKDETADLSSKALATEDWQTYRNEKYGFEIKYPEDWRCGKHWFLEASLVTCCSVQYFDENKKMCWPDDLPTPIFFIELDIYAGKMEIAEGGGLKILSKTQIIIDRREGLLTETEIKGEKHLTARWKKNSSDFPMYVLSTSNFDKFPQSRDIFNQMLSSFRFLDPVRE